MRPQFRVGGRNDKDQVLERKSKIRKMSASASDAQTASLDAYIDRVIGCLAYQVVESGGMCPLFVTIPEPADALQSEYVGPFVQSWARERFNVPMIEVRIEDGDHVRSVQ